MIGGHLPILLVAILLLAAPICVLIRREQFAWLIATFSIWLSLASACTLMVQILNTGEVEYYLGGWMPPFGIEYNLDSLNTAIIILILSITGIIITFGRQSIKREIEPHRQHLFYCVFLLTLIGLLGITATADLFNVYVFLEVSSLGSYVLIGLGKKRQALKASYRYLIQGTIGATFILIGIGFLYAMTGTLNMADLANRIEPLYDSRPVIVAITIILVGIFIKLALFPLHLWLPGAYTYAPSVVSAFLAATSTKVAAYLLIRFIYSVIGYEIAFDHFLLSEILISLSLIAILVGSIAAIMQSDVKRILAYSSISQIGYLVVGIGIPSITGLTAGITHMFNHSLTKGAMFLAVGCVVYRIGNSKLENFCGIGKKMPFTSSAILIGGLGLIEFPLMEGLRFIIYIADNSRLMYFVYANHLPSEENAKSRISLNFESSNLKKRPVSVLIK